MLKGARAILAGRGSLAGVHALLNAIFGARRFVVVDRSEQLAPIALGGGGFPGSRLPSFLAGPSVRVPKLNARLVLGTTPLCSTDTGDASLARPPELLVVIPASGTERRRYGAALQRMLEEMIPAGVRLRLRWTAMQQGLIDAADVVTVVAEPLPLRLGDGQALGAARLGSDGRLRLRDGGVTAEHRFAVTAHGKQEARMSCDEKSPKIAGHCGPCSPATRNRYFRGKLLTVSDYQAEQRYMIPGGG